MAQRAPDSVTVVLDGVTAGRRGLLTSAPAIVVLMLCYVGILQYAYVTQIAPVFTYLQYGYRTPDPLGYGVAVALAVGLALMMPRRIAAPSHFIVWVLFIIAIVPSLVVPQWAPALPPGEALEMALWVGGCSALVVGLGTRQPLRGFVPRHPLRMATFWQIVAGLFVVLNAYSLRTAGVHFTLPSLDNVYGLRGEFHGLAAQHPDLGYAVPLLTGLINPVMMARGLWDRRPLWFVTGVLGQVYVYAVDGDKSAFLSPIAIVATFLLLRRGRRPVGASALVGAAVLAVVAMAVGLTSLLVRRFLITPGLVAAGYVQVFDQAPKAHLGYSVLRGIVSYPYLAEPPDLVGRWFFGDPTTHANTGWLGDGYANFGYPGMVGATVILVLLLWAIDDASRGLPLGFTCLFFLAPALTLCEAAILTAILTHGIAVAIVLCAFAPRTGWARSGALVGDGPEVATAHAGRALRLPAPVS
jgi:hypothetical protein